MKISSLIMVVVISLVACSSSDKPSGDDAAIVDFGDAAVLDTALAGELGSPEAGTFAGTFPFASDRDIATAYFSWEMMRYGWPALYTYAKTLAKCAGSTCPAMTVAADTTTLSATASCADQGRTTTFEGTMTRAVISGGERFSFSNFKMDVDGLIGVQANGMAERFIDQAKEPVVERLVVKDSLEIVQYGPWTPWNNNAFPGAEPLAITFRQVDYTRTIYQDRVEEVFTGMVEVPGRGSFKASGSWSWNRLSQCNDDEPWQGSLVAEGKTTLTFSFDGATACDRRIPFAHGDGKKGSVLLEGNVPVVGASCE